MKLKADWNQILYHLNWYCWFLALSCGTLPIWVYFKFMKLEGISVIPKWIVLLIPLGLLALCSYEKTGRKKKFAISVFSDIHFDNRIFQNKDIIVFDLFPMLNPGETLPERIRRQEEESYYQLQKKYQEGKIPEERYINTPLQSIMVQTRYLDYLWEYYQEHLSELIVKAE